MITRRISLLAILALSLTALSCQTVVTQDGITLTDEQAKALDEPKKKVNVMDERIKAALDGLEFRRGSGLLKDIHFLVETRELALPHIVERLPEASPKVQASMLYVLGFSRTRRASETLVNYLDNGDGVVRYEAAAGLLNHGNMSAVPVLISFLESDNKPFRFKAIQALRLGTGKNFGYEFSAPESMRHESVTLWKGWWAKEKSRLMARRDSEG